QGWVERREGTDGRVGLLRSVSPRGRAEQLQSAGSGRWGGRCAGSGRCAEPPLESAERGCRGAGGEERTPRRRGTARRGRSRTRHRDLLLACRRALSSRLIYFFPTYTLIRWDFFFPPFPAEPPPAPFPPSLASLDFFFFPVTIPIFKAVDAEREAERAGGRRSARPLRHRHPDVRSGLGLSPFLPPGEATPARREEGAQQKRCIETFRANFVASARSRERARRGCLPAPAPGERPRTGAAVELGLPGGGGRAAAGRPRSLRSALRSAHRERQRGPAESRPYGGVKAETPKRRPPFPGAPRSAREAAGAEEARARARQRGGGGGAAARRSAAGPAPRRAPATMNFLLTWIHWGLAALLYLQSAELSKAAPALGDGERKPNEVIKFLEVYERSFCRTIETLVDIFQEYPDEVEYIFRPSCVPLMRCAGCCGDEGLECVPVDVYNVTMEIARIKPHQSQHIAHMSFLQHSKCDCRPKKDVKNKQEKKSKRGKGKGQKRKRKKGRYKPPSFHCEPCSERRKHLFVQDPQTCKCSCKFTDSRCKSRQLELNERTCRCEKPRR
uniref:Vascular endothelial growth factor A n=1 Tax=Phasianus colchicus TaxID=9054 RepID=A0A669P5P7_PHACC